MLAVFKHLNAVDENMFHADCVLVRIFVRRLVCNRFRIKYYHVGKVPLPDKTATFEAQVCGLGSNRVVVPEPKRYSRRTPKRWHNSTKAGLLFSIREVMAEVF